MFIVLSGFATTDLSVRFCDAYQGGEAYGKTASPQPYFSLTPFPAGYPLNLWVTLTVCTARRRPVTEPCERTGEEAEWSKSPH
ncbi:TPA: hypothetical protein I4D94_23420 [Enterobacter asburiae]|nr:hypothetical protein [Enterobacter asburiae]